MNEATAILTIISLSLGIISAISIGLWKIIHYLNDLSELPGDVRDVVKELRKMNERIAEVRGESKAWRQDSTAWHEWHMIGHAEPKPQNHHGERGP